MDYWKERPEKLLLDERLTGMTPEELMAWFWLRQRARTQTPPGVLPGDDETLRRWSGLRPKAWRESRDVVLGMFVKDEQGRLHDIQTREEYLEFCRMSHKFSVEQARKSNKRWGKKDSDPRFADPYASHPMPRHPAGYPLHSSGLPQNGVSASETTIDPTASHGIAAGMPGYPNNQLTHSIDERGNDPPPAQGAAVTPSPPQSPHRPKFTSRPPLKPVTAEEQAEFERRRQVALNALTESPAAPPPAEAARENPNNTANP